MPLLWALVFQAMPRSEAWAEALLLAGPWVLVPLGLESARRHEGLRLAAAAALTAALALDAGLFAASLCLPWLAWTMREACQAGKQAMREPESLCAAAAWIFLVVGAAWALADRAGWRPLGFDPVLVRLTAIHFHHAGFSAPLLAAWAAGRVPGLGGRITCALMIAGVPLTALGITATRLDAWPGWETISATVMVAAGLGTAWLCARVARREPHRVARTCLAVASFSLTLGSLLALSYAWRFFRIPLLPDIPSMRAWHGSLNAIGFGLTGLVGRAWSKVDVPTGR